MAAHDNGRVKCVAGRATDFFGPGVTVSALGDRFWPALLAGKTFNWVGDPDAVHSFAYLPDLAEAYIALAQTPSAWGQVWHLPALPPVSVREICVMVTANRDTKTRMRQTPSWLLRVVGLIQPAAGELVEMRYMFDNEFIINHSAFGQKIVTNVSGWDAALKETIAWWQDVSFRTAVGVPRLIGAQIPCDATNAIFTHIQPRYFCPLLFFSLTNFIVIKQPAKAMDTYIKRANRRAGSFNSS